MPCAATWTSRGPRATACSESPAGQQAGQCRVGVGGVSRAKCWGWASWARVPIRHPGWVGSGGVSLGLAWPSLWPHSVSAQKMDNASFTLYEFWQDEASWRRYDWCLKTKIY